MIKPLLITLLICATLVYAGKKTPPAKQTTTQSKNSSPGKDELSDDDAQDSDQDESSDEDDDADSSDDDEDDDGDSSSKSKSKSSKSKEIDSKSKSSKSKGTNSVSSKSKNKINSQPSLTCIIFSDVGCSVECIMIGAMYNLKTEGLCNIRNTCDCTSSQDASLDKLWKRKFNSDAILRQIKKKPSLAKQVREKLKQPFRTEKQSKQDLKSILSPVQFKKLRPLDISFASQLTKPNGKLDYGKIESYVLGILRWVLPSPNNRVRGIKFQDKLRDALKKTKNTNTLQHIISEVRQSKNKDLVNIVDEYVKKNKKFKEKPVSRKVKDAAETLEDFIGFTIIDEFINYIKHHTWLDRVTSLPFQPPQYMTWLPPPPPLPVVYWAPPPPPPPVYVPPLPPVFVPPMPPMPPMPQGYYY